MKNSKRLILTLALIAPIALGVMSCRDRAAERRIAELESRLLQLEGGGQSSAASTTGTAATAVPTPAATTATTAAAEQKPEGPLPVIAFDNVSHDFGTIQEGQKVEYTYTFKNTGEAPLIIQSAQPSCGCTAPDWTKEPIPVGGTGFVKAEFDSSGKPNIQNKTITVTANTWPKTTTLRFTAMVNPKASGANGPLQ